MAEIYWHDLKKTSFPDSNFKFSWLGLFHCISEWLKSKCKILIFIVVAVQQARSSHAQHKMVSLGCTIISVRLWNFNLCKLFGQESTYHQGKIFKKFLRVMTSCRKVPKLYFQSQFWKSKINQIFSKKNYLGKSI